MVNNRILILRQDFIAGVGLSIVHGIVKGYGSDIKDYCETGVGGQFHLILPLAKEAAKMKASLPTGKETILLVDDDMVLLEIWETLLKSLGYTVDKRACASEALEAFNGNSQKYDLIITDMTMPKVTGDKLAREIRRVRNDIPIILNTGFSAENDDALTELNINALLMKPATFMDLANTVRKVLDEKACS